MSSLSLPEPPKEEPWPVTGKPSDKVNALCKLGNAEKYMVCHKLLLAWKLFPEPSPGEGEVPDEHLTGEPGPPVRDNPILLDSEGNVTMTNKEVAAGSVRVNVLAAKRTKTAATSGGGGQSKQEGMSVPKKRVVKLAAEKSLPLLDHREKRPLEGADAPLTKRSKADESIRPKLVDSTGKVLPGDLLAFQDNVLAHRLLRANVLSVDYDSCFELSGAERREVLDRFWYRVHCLEMAEWDAIELEEVEAATSKKATDEAIATKAELEKAKPKVEKLATDTEVTRAALADELAKVKADMADLQKATDVAAGERDRLNKVVKQVNDEKNELAEAKLLAKTDVEVKDAYIHHLAYLLEP